MCKKGMSHLLGRHHVLGSHREGALVRTVLKVGLVTLDTHIGVTSKVEKIDMLAMI